MDLHKFAIIKYYEKEEEWKDITEEVKFFNDKKTYYEITYNNGNLFPDKKRNIKIITEPQQLNAEDLAFFHKDIPLVDVLQILKFNEWIRVFFKSGENRSYLADDIKYKEITNKEPKVKNFLKYLCDITSYIEDETGVLNSQLQELTILKNSVLYNIINCRKSAPFNIDSKKLIFPFSYNKSQKEAVFNALNNNISLIQGPPGTGKTQTILNIIANLIYKNKTVAVVAGNNEATRNIKDKLQEANLDFLTAYIGKKDNLEEFFSSEHTIPDICTEWKSKQFNVNALEQDLFNLNSNSTTTLQYQVDVSKIRNLISELKIEKTINDANFAITSDISPKIINKHFTFEKLLILKAELEVLPENKITGFFTKIRFLFKYGIFDTNKHLENRNDIINYLTSKHYEMKLTSLQRDLDKKAAFLDRYKDLNTMERIITISNDMLHTRVCQLYLNEINLHKKNYKFYYTEFLKRFPIVFSTTHALSITSGHSYLYDYVIMDESSQIDLASAVVALSCAKNVVLVGDLMQLPNIVKAKDKNSLKKIFEKYSLPNYLEYTANSILKSVHTQYENQIPNTLLNEHYRCDPEIIGFCNKRFYDNNLIIRTEHKPGNGVKITYTESHHARDHINERQVDIIEQEIIPTLDTKEVGIIAPFRDQVELLNSRLSNTRYLIDTVHKFQGKEKSNIIISTVVNKVKINEDSDNVDFLNDPNLLNVAISRAKNKLYLVISEDLMKQSGAILSDFARYIKYFCEGGKVEKTQVYSVLDLMFQDYSPVLESFKKKMIKVSEFDSENVIATLINEVCEEKKFGIFGYVAHYALQKLVRPETITDEADKKFLLNPNTHCDFVVFDKLDKSIKMVIEVDGMQHNAKTQSIRDVKKNRILNNASIPILRIKTTSSNCKEKIEAVLKEEMERKN